MVADTGNSTLRRIDLNTLAVSTPFGTPGKPGTADGIGNAARFDHPRGVAFSSPVPGGSDLYVADTGNATLRKVAGAGGGGNAVATLSGRPPTRGSTDSPGVPLMRQPRQAALDAQGDDLYVADSGNHTIRQVAPDGTTLTWAGTAGQAGSANGAAIGAALFNTPSGVAVDAAGDVYVADTLNHTIRKITPESVNQVRTVSTLAGVAGQSGSSDSSGSGPTGALFNQPLGLSIDDSDGNVYVADSANHIIRQVEPDGTTTTWAGTPGTAGSADGPATGFGSALFNRPSAVAVGPGGVVYVADTFNHTLRIIQTDAAGVRRVDTLAGQAGMGDSVDNPVGQNARLDFPAALALDMDGNVFVANTGSSTVSVVTPEGSVSTFLGIKALSGVPDDLGTNPAPLPTRICPPYGVAVDPVSGHDFINFIYVVLDDAVLKVPLVPPEPSP
jgi:DNA-binding beta-propeller fold protein YncE